MIVIVQSIIVNLLMQAGKRIMGLQWAQNPKYTKSLRIALAVVSIVVAILTSASTGAPIDSTSIAMWVGIILDACATFFMSHGMYSLVLSKV